MPAARWNLGKTAAAKTTLTRARTAIDAQMIDGKLPVPVDDARHQMAELASEHTIQWVAIPASGGAGQGSHVRTKFCGSSPNSAAASAQNSFLR